MQQPMFVRALAPLLAIVILTGLAEPALAQESPSTTVDAEPDLAALDDTSVDDDFEPITDENWSDPVVPIGFAEEDLAPVPEFDFGQLHRSEVFATGVDMLTVKDDPLPAARDRHLRVLQLKETLRLEVVADRSTLRRLRPIARRLTGEIQHERSEEARLAAEIELLKRLIKEFAILSFIDGDQAATALSGPVAELLENRVIVDELRAGHFDDITVRETELAERQARRARLESERADLQAEIGVTVRHRDMRSGQLDQTTELAARTGLSYTHILHERLPTEVVGTDIPLVTLNAYVIAERVTAVEQPGCQIGWWMLAGIGRIESGHGQIFGYELDVDGYPSEDILGPELDGRILAGEEFLEDGVAAPEPTGRTESTELEPAGDATQPGNPADLATVAPVPVIKRLALIRDTDGGELDGDTTYDRAVGPMQFIPQTWRQYGTDANLDEVADPQNVYDASMSSARYLCVAAGSMADIAGQERAYFAYNHDEEYVVNVAEAGERYRTLIEIPTGEDSVGMTSELGIYDPPDLTIEPEDHVGFVTALRDLMNTGNRARANGS